MTVKQLRKLLRNYENEFTVTIQNNHIKVVGMYPSGDFFEEYINSAGGTWEGGVGYAPNGQWCGECSTFDCDKCDWREGESMNCTICGKKMDYTGFGNYRCQECGHALSDLVDRPSNCDIPMPQGFGKQEGWICPVCGRGVAPWVDYCPCQINRNITFATGTSTYTNLDAKEFEKYATTNCEELKL